MWKQVRKSLGYEDPLTLSMGYVAEWLWQWLKMIAHFVDDIRLELMTGIASVEEEEEEEWGETV